MSAQKGAADFGRTLREARERRGLSLRQISNATKISMPTLEALERNDFARLPGGIFGRGVVRSYAVEVGLDPESTLETFIGQLPHDAAITASRPAAAQIEDFEQVESDRRMASAFLRLALISLPIAVFVGYFATHGRQPSKAEPPRRPAPAAPVLPARSLEPIRPDVVPAIAVEPAPIVPAP